MSAAEKPRYRVKARRLGAVVELKPSADADALAAIDEFRGHAERMGVQAVGLVLVASDGSAATRYWHGQRYWQLCGALNRLAYRMHRESE